METALTVCTCLSLCLLTDQPCVNRTIVLLPGDVSDTDHRHWHVPSRMVRSSRCATCLRSRRLRARAPFSRTVVLALAPAGLSTRTSLLQPTEATERPRGAAPQLRVRGATWRGGPATGRSCTGAGVHAAVPVRARRSGLARLLVDGRSRRLTCSAHAARETGRWMS